MLSLTPPAALPTTQVVCKSQKNKQVSYMLVNALVREPRSSNRTGLLK